MKIKDSTWLTGILMVGLTVAMLPMAQAATTYLSPSGGDDTPALQAALNSCIGATTDCVVQLSAGTFHTRQLAVQNLRGTLRGAGKSKTVILAEEGLTITRHDTWYQTQPGPDNSWPILITFLDGAVNLQGFTIRISEAQPTKGYFEPYIVGREAYFLWAAVLFTNTNTQPMSSSVDEVGIEGKVVDASVGTPILPSNVYVGYCNFGW